MVSFFAEHALEQCEGFRTTWFSWLTAYVVFISENS